MSTQNQIRKIKAYMCNYSNVCSCKVVGEDEKVWFEINAKTLIVTDEEKKIYTRQSIFFLFLQRVIENIEKRVFPNLPNNGEGYMIYIYAMFDAELYRKAIISPQTPAEKFVSQKFIEKKIVRLGLFGDVIIKDMALDIRTKLPALRASGKLIEFKDKTEDIKPFAGPEDAWDDVYQAYSVSRETSTSSMCVVV